MVNIVRFDIFKGKHFKIELHWLKLSKLTTDGLNPTTLVPLYLCFLSLRFIFCQHCSLVLRV